MKQVYATRFMTYLAGLPHLHLSSCSVSLYIRFRIQTSAHSLKLEGGRTTWNNSRSFAS